MVWGFYFPSAGGKFTPGTDYEVGDDGQSKYALRLNTYFHALPDDEKKEIEEEMGDAFSYSSFVSAKLCSGPSHRYAMEGAYHKPGKQIEDWQLPKSLTVTGYHSRYFRLGDLFVGGGLIVSAALKDTIEFIEPDTHRFFPIKVTNPFDKDGDEREFFIFIVGQYLDTFEPSASNPELFKKYDGYDLYHSSPTKKYFSGLAMSAERVRGAHLWSELRFTTNMYCISDELKAAVDAAGLEIPRHHKIREV